MYGDSPHDSRIENFDWFGVGGIDTGAASESLAIDAAIPVAETHLGSEDVGIGILISETEKTTDQIEAPASGVLLKIIDKEGTTVPVNAVIGVIGSAHEDLSLIPELRGIPTAPARPHRRSQWS